MVARLSAMAAGLGLMLSACGLPQDTAAVPPGLPGDMPSPSRIAATAEQADITVGGAAFIIRAPRGFCIDPTAIQETEGGALFLLGDCVPGEDAVTNPAQFSPTVLTTARAAPFDGILSVSVAPDSPFVGWSDEERVAILEELIQAGLGTELLGRGDAADVPGATRVLQTRHRGDTLYVLLQDEPRGALEGASPRFWRAFAEEGGRTMVLTVTSFEQPYPGDAVLLRAISSLRDAIKAANRAET
ncbi:MAG: hypothetical protein AAGJ96_08245 [Pseudomonadota bacterium]